MQSQIEEFRYLDDTRTPEEVLHQQQVVADMQLDNIRNFKLKLTDKKKVKYEPGHLQRIDLGDSWYCNITDNGLLRRHTVLTMHGFPGDHREWAGLEHQMKESCRWINFVVPGFDGEDERRGTYNGSMRDLSELLVRLLKKLGVPKIIFVGHSMGSIYMTYFVQHYPQYVEGTVSITGIVDTWYIGLLGFYRIITITTGLNIMVPNRNEPLNDNTFRQRITKLVEEQGKLVRFGPVKFPKVTESEICGYIKLLNSADTGLSQQFELNRQLAVHLPKVYIHGRIDPLENNYLTEEMFYRRCYIHHTNQLNKDKVNLVRQQLLNRCREIDVELNLNNLQANFCWNFEETGHNAHKRRPKEISRILQAYFIVLEELQRAEGLQRTRL